MSPIWCVRSPNTSIDRRDHRGRLFPHARTERCPASRRVAPDQARPMQRGKRFPATATSVGGRRERRDPRKAVHPRQPNGQCPTAPPHKPASPMEGPPRYDRRFGLGFSALPRGAIAESLRRTIGRFGGRRILLARRPKEPGPRPQLRRVPRGARNYGAQHRFGASW